MDARCLRISYLHRTLRLRFRQGKPLSDYRNPSTLDSMIYYYGQVQGYDYLKRAQNDTSMLTEEQRRLYLDGVRAGIEALREGAKNEIYNQGVRRGARIAMKVMEIEREYNVTFNDDFFMESLTYVLMNPEIHNNGIAAQKSFYNLYDGIRNKHRSDMRKEAMRNLTEEARDLKLSKIDSNLYYRIIHKGSANTLIPAMLSMWLLTSRRLTAQTSVCPLPNVSSSAHRVSCL